MPKYIMKSIHKKLRAVENLPLIFFKDGKDVSYHCIASKCNLKYKSFTGLRRHIIKYDHSFYGMTVNKDMIKNIFLKNSHEEYLENDKKSHKCYYGRKKHTANLKEIDIKAILELKDSLIKNIFERVFSNGILRIMCPDNDPDPDKYACKIPGCGKVFKSLLAYRYHCETFLHNMRYLIKDYAKEASRLVCSGELLASDLFKLFGVQHLFKISGVTHHTSITPDSYFPIIFALSDKIETKPKKNIENFVPLFKSLPEKNTENLGINLLDSFGKIFLDGEEYRNVSKFESQKIFIKCLGEFVSCTAFADTCEGCFLFIALKPSKTPDNLFGFCDGISMILVMNKNFEILHEIKFNFGFIRKMYVSIHEKTFVFIALFNDGKLRSFKFKDNIFDIFEYTLRRIVDICCAPVSKIILATTGFEIYKIEKNEVALSSTRFECPIISLAIKDSKPIEIPSNDKDELQRPRFFYLNIDGKLMCCDVNFRNEKDIYKLTGLTEIKYLNEIDFIFLTDSFELLTKYICFRKGSENTHLLHRFGATTVLYHSNLIFLGSFCGMISKLCLKKKKFIPGPILKCVQQNNDFFFYSKESEIKDLCRNVQEQINYGTAVSGIFYHMNNLLVIYRNGLMVCIKGIQHMSE